MVNSNGKKATMNDIADKLGISKNSVSLALNNKSGVSDDLRKKIIDTASSLNYGTFSAQDNTKSKCIVVVVPEYIQNDTFFYSDVFWSIEKEAKSRGCISITSSVSKETEHGLIEPLLPRDMSVLGLLVIGVVSEAYMKKLYELGFPLVTVDILYNNVAVNSISSANLNGAYTATSYLIENGHKNIGFVGPIHTAQSIYERWCGFYQALSKAGLESHREYNIIGEINHFELFDTTTALEKYLNQLTKYPTAWFCAGDRIAIALIQLLQQRNISVPEQISVVGFDDIPIAQLIRPALTTIKVNRKFMGKLAVERLIAMQTESKRVIDINLPGALIIRDSVKNIND